MAETWEQWRKRTEAAERKRQRTINIEIGFEIDFGCEWKAWPADLRYERCTRHGEVRRAPTPQPAA